MDFQALNAFDEWTLIPNFSYDVDEDEESDFEDFIDEIIYNEELGVQVKKEKKRRVKNNYSMMHRINHRYIIPTQPITLPHQLLTYHSALNSGYNEG